MVEYNTCVMCGKRYKACGYCRSDKTAFHWRTKCCSPACAVKYFIAIDSAIPEPLSDVAAEPAAETPAAQEPKAVGKKPARRSKSKKKAEPGAADAQ